MRRRLLLVPVLAVLLFTTLALLAAPGASAHPLGNFTINRYTGLVLSPGRIELRYVVDMAEIPTFQETSSIDTNGDGSIDAGERKSWADRQAVRLMGNFSLAVDGKPVPLDVVSVAARLRPGQAGLPVLSFTGSFRGTLANGWGTLRYADRNFPGRVGWKEVTARSREGVALSGSTVPAVSVSGELEAYPKDLLSSPLDVSEATVSFHPGRGTMDASPPSGSGSVAGGPVASGGSFAALVGRPLTPMVLLLSLLLAFGFGAAHALGPGHGKTITAAYLVGRGARTSQAAAVGAAVALMHTASVLALGLVVFVVARSFPAERVYPWLTLGTGLVALVLGAGLLLARIRARRRGLDPWHGHDHGPGHRAGHSPHAHHEPRPISGRGLVGLAVAGGILPSPTAFVVLTGAVAAHRVGYGLVLILAFSMGLAASLMAVGMLALRARALVGRGLAGRWVRLIPILSALVIVAFGFFFATKGITQLS